MLKRTLLALALIAAPLAAIAQTEATQAEPNANPVTLIDSTTRKPHQIDLSEAKNPDLMATFLPKIDGVEPLFRLYVSKGYAPFHAYILTNADVMKVLSEVDPSLPVNPNVIKKIDSIRNLYQPVEQ